MAKSKYKKVLHPDQVATLEVAAADDNKYSPPLKIKFTSDGCEIEFQKYDVELKMYIYKYTFSPGNIKTGMTLPLKEDELKKLIKVNETLK